MHSLECFWLFLFEGCRARGVLRGVLCGIAQLGMFFLAELHSSGCSRELFVSAATQSASAPYRRALDSPSSAVECVVSEIDIIVCDQIDMAGLECLERLEVTT